MARTYAGKKRSKKGRAKKAKLYKVVPGYTQVKTAYKYSGYSQEKKYLDKTLLSVITTAGTMNDGFVFMQQGQSASTRIGNKICVRNINATVVVDNNGGLGSLLDPVAIRVIIAWDLQANGATAITSDILAAPATVYAHRNMETVERFRVLKDKTIMLGEANAQTGALTSRGTAGRIWKYAWKGEMDVHYGGNVGTVADLRSENLLMLVIGNQAVGQVQGQLRVKFTDS